MPAMDKKLPMNASVDVENVLSESYMSDSV